MDHETKLLKTFGMIVPFDQDERRLIREVCKALNRWRARRQERRYSEADVVRAAIRQYCHDLVGQNTIL